jgi:hypothetical protein
MGSLDYYLNHRHSRYANRDSPDFGTAFGVAGGNDRLPYKRYRGPRVHHIVLGEMPVMGSNGGESRDVSPAPPPYFEDTDGLELPEKPDHVYLDSKSQW